MKAVVGMGRDVGGGREFSNDLAVVLRQSVARIPSEWYFGLGFHLNGPLASVSI